tara:strand:- start:678 stop:1022 length:345 start_codon:yes stop_codon:yes gene_type:complete
MKKSELRQIIQEEIKAVIEAEDVNRTINDKFKAKMGFKSPEGKSGNKFKEKEYKFEFVHYEYKSTIKVPGTVFVIASNEDEARDKAYEEAKKFCEEEYVKLKSKKEEFKLLSTK